jgi:predicted RNase H-like HicB family nuclease
MDIEFTCQILKEGKTYVAYSPELDVSSCGSTRERARRNLLEAVRLFLQEAERMGTLEQILQEAGYVRHKQKLKGPKFITAQPVSLSLPLVHAGD